MSSLVKLNWLNWLNWRCGVWTGALSVTTMAAWAGAPSITVQPVSAGVQRGQSAVFTVTARSAAPATTLTYQWRRNGVNLAGATASSYRTPVTTLTDDNALYSVQVKSAGVTVTSTAARLTVVPGFVAGSTGSGHSEVLGENGSVWTWGNSLPNLRANPAAFSTEKLSRTKTSATGAGLTGVAELSAGMNFVLARGTDRTLLTWGDGYLGDGGSTYRAYPVPVRYASGVAVGNMVSTSAGGNFAVAARSDGTVWSWGTEQHGQLANGTASLYRSLAKPVLTTTGAALANVASISAGAVHSVVVLRNGTVYAWGFNGAGQLGIGKSGYSTSSMRAVPVMAAAGVPLTGVVAAVAGADHTLFLKTDGSVWGVGASDLRQLGSAVSSVPRVYPVRVLDLQGVALTGMRSLTTRDSHSVAIRTNGTVYAWGYLTPGLVPSPVFTASP